MYSIEKQLPALKRGQELKIFKNRKKSRYIDSLRDRVNNKEARKHEPRLKEGKPLKRETEALTISAQDQAIRTNFIKTMVDKSQNDPKCRICKKNNETISHIASSCSKLAQKEYMTMWLVRSIGTCHENVGLNEMRGGMTMFQRVCLKMRITNFYGTSVCEQTMKSVPGDRIW